MEGKKIHLIKIKKKSPGRRERAGRKRSGRGRHGILRISYKLRLESCYAIKRRVTQVVATKPCWLCTVSIAKNFNFKE